MLRAPISAELVHKRYRTRLTAIHTYPILLCLPFHGRSEEVLKTTLLKIAEQDYPKENLYLFLIDNMSNESLRKVASSFIECLGSQYRGAEIVRTEGNVPYVRNLGLAKAISLKSKFIFYVDSDVILKPDSLSNLVKIAQEDKKILSVGQSYLTPIENEGFIYGTKRKYANFSTLDKREIVDVQGTGMGATIIRMSLLDKVGWFDERIPFIEDLNLGKRATDLRYRVVLDKRDPLLHARKFSTGDVMKTAYNSGRAELVNMRVNGTWRSELRSSAYWLSLIGSIPLALLTPIPLMLLLILGFLRYSRKAHGRGRILLFPAMFLSKVPKTIGLIKALLERPKEESASRIPLEYTKFR